MRFVNGTGIGLALAVLSGSIVAPVASLAQGAQSPYDTVYVVKSDAEMRVAVETSSTVKTTLSKGTEGVVMRWCRNEFNFRDWAYGSISKRRSMLKSRVCEVQVDGKIGFVEAKHLEPM